MILVTIHEAKTHHSRLIARAEAGEDVIVARGRTPVVRIAPLQNAAKPRRAAGRFADTPGAKQILEQGFWDPLPDDALGLGLNGGLNG